MGHEVGHAERLGIRVAPLVSEAQLPAVVTQPRSNIEIAKAAVQRSTDAFELVAAGKDLHATNKIASWASRHEDLIMFLGLGSIGLGVLSLGAAFVKFEGVYLWGILPAVVGFATSMVLDFGRVDLKKMIDGRVLDSANVEPILTALKESTPEERALVRLFVEQKTTELEQAERLTPAAALALRQAIKGAVANHDELDRVAIVAAFVAKHQTTNVSDNDLYALNRVLQAASPAERVAAADYIDSTLFPNERPLRHLAADQARKLYGALAYFRGFDVPAPPTGPATPESPSSAAA